MEKYECVLSEILYLSNTDRYEDIKSVIRAMEKINDLITSQCPEIKPDEE